MGCNESQAEHRPPQAMRWWGWGEAGAPPALSAHALAQVKEAIALPDRRCPPVALRAVKLPESALPPRALSALQRVLRAGGVRSDHFERVVHAAGRGHLDLIALRSGEIEQAPDAVLHPASAQQLKACLAICSLHRIAVVPFGGGTSVVGGLSPIRGEHEAVVSLDLQGLSGVGPLDRRSLCISVGAGGGVASLEQALRSKGLTLGHFPQSFQYVTVGGCAATRSAGQASSGYGRFDQMVLGLRLIAPVGEIDLPAMPASAAGPDLREMIVGSEGALGTISRVDLKVRPRPQVCRYEGLMFGEFTAGTAALAQLAQEQIAPAVCRLSEERETGLSIALSSSGGAKDVLGELYLRLRGHRHGCLAILGFEGSEEQVRAQRRRAIKVARRHGALPLGDSPGQAWQRSRFNAPYLRDDLLTYGAIVETLETATLWSNIERLRIQVTEAISGALARCGTPGLVGCHISHVYHSGASLYFTFLAPLLLGEERRQWEAVKRAASEAILMCGGTITHHHGVGSHHAPWLRREVGSSGIATIAAIKQQLDPQGVMNPGKLLPEGI